MRKIKILEMIDDASIGGGQVHVLMLAKYLDRDEFDISIACKGQGYLVDEALKSGIKVISIAMDNRLRLKTFREVTRMLRKSKFDIIHTHGGTAGFWGRIGSFVAGTPAIRIHSYHGMHYLTKNHSFPRYLKTVDRLLLSVTNNVVCVCSSDYKKGLESGIANQKKAVIIPCGIEVEKFTTLSRNNVLRAESGIRESDILFGSVGRLHVQKGQRYLLEAFQYVKSKHTHVWLWIVGEGELRGELEKLAKDYGVHDSVRFLGARANIPEILSAIDVFVLPSLWEGQPITILEALAAGKPVIATSVDGISDILVNGRNALLVPAKDPDSLAAAMNRMIRDVGLRTRISAAARETVSDKFTAEKMAEQFGVLYQKTCAMHAGKDFSMV